METPLICGLSKFSSKFGETECHLCPEGTYQDASAGNSTNGFTKCIPCKIFIISKNISFLKNSSFKFFLSINFFLFFF